MDMEVRECGRLGSSQMAAAPAAFACQQRNLLGRSSVLTFLVFAVSPVLSLVALDLIGLFALIVVARRVGLSSGSGIHAGFLGEAAAPYLLTALIIVVPAAILTASYYVLAERLGVGRRWIMVSCLVLSILAGLAMCDVRFSDLPGQSQLTLGLGFGTGQLWQLSQGVAPLAIGLWLLRRSRLRELRQSISGTALPA